MSRLFSKVSPAVWGSQRFMTLPSNEAKLLYLYLLTNEHMNSAGAFRLKEGYAVSDLGWEAECYRQCLVVLVTAGLIAHDAETSEIYIMRWFRHNPAQNEKHAQGCNRLIGQLDSEHIAELAYADFSEAEEKRVAASVKTTPGLRASLQAVNGGRGW